MNGATTGTTRGTVTLGETVDGSDVRLLADLPNEFEIFAVAVSRGTKELDVQIDDSGHEADQCEVVVNYPDKPVLLVLAAHEPTVWRVGRTPDTKIAGILISGYYTQALIGVDKTTPYSISTSEKKGEFSYFYADGLSPRSAVMEAHVVALTGQEIKEFTFKPRDGVFYIGERLAKAQDVIYSNDLTLEDYVDPSLPLAGQKGLDQLFKQGKLRFAKQEDIDAWMKKAKKDSGRTSLLRVGYVYVILKPITLPAGLYGAHSRAFIIPEGVPFPEGPKCHNSFFLMDGSAHE